MNRTAAAMLLAILAMSACKEPMDRPASRPTQYPKPPKG